MNDIEDIKVLERDRAIELIAARELLRRWVKKYAPSCKPGGWDYDHDAADLCQTTATLLGIGDPWN